MKPVLILCIILGYFLLLLVISYFTSRKADNNSFFVGNRVSPWYVVAFGMIGASLSGVTYISVPGYVVTGDFYYMQMVLGFVIGYAVIAEVLLPLYYRLQLTSIYAYLGERYGRSSYKTGSFFFLISRLIGASFRLFLVAEVLHLTVFESLHVHYLGTVGITLALIFVYTFKGGIRTIVWTDTLQTFFMLLAVGLSIYFISRLLDLNFGSMVSAISSDPHAKLFNWDWKAAGFFPKQFISGIFMAIVMTGLDQDMMQKNLSCRNLKDAKKNMYWYGSMFVPINLLFLGLGVLLIMYVNVTPGLLMPGKTDELFPMVIQSISHPQLLGIVFLLGLIAAAYSSADSALTALTTSFTIDILEGDKLPEKKLKNLRWKVHIGMAVIIGIIIFAFRLLNNEAVIKKLYEIASYTYGPLLGLFAFGLLTKLQVKDKWVPLVAVLSPGLTYLLKMGVEHFASYQFAFELLILNGIISFAGLMIISKSPGKAKIPVQTE
ncbi:MAG: sodium:solute symporter [Bacteroidales bacterium]|nr:sodium:solute symporter [Bacteroidales bacterium]